MNKRYESGIRVLRAIVRGFQLEGTDIQRAITKSKGDKKHQLRVKKGSLGCTARYHFLAYAFLRGLPYKVVEQHTNCPPHVDSLLKVVSSHENLTFVTEVTNGRSYSRWVPWTREMIEGWLMAVPEVVATAEVTP